MVKVVNVKKKYPLKNGINHKRLNCDVMIQPSKKICNTHF